MNSHRSLSRPDLLAIAAIALLGLVALLAFGARADAAPKVVTKECQHPLTTGQEAVNIKGVSPAAACKVVRALGVYIYGGGPNSYKKIYECVGANARHPGTPKLTATEFEGWKLRLINGYGLQLHKPGASFRVTGTDFPINCS
jgi:hypothetical protein